MSHEIIHTNLGGPSNISCASGWAMKQIYLGPVVRSPDKLSTGYRIMQPS